MRLALGEGNEQRKPSDTPPDIAEYFRIIRSARGDIAIYFRVTSEMFTRLSSCPHQARVTIAQHLGGSELAYIRGIAGSAATWSVRERRAEWLAVGIQAIGLMAPVDDTRELLRELAVLYYAANRLKVSLEDLFHRISPAPHPDEQGLFERFFASPLSLGQVGYRESVDEAGEFRFESTL